jgi:adenylosuccinate synthase
MRAQPSATIVVGLGFGDEGKGATVDHIAASLPTARVVRFNGGQQAGHNVIHDGFHHTFANYGSGTLSGVPTWISQHCTINPLNTREEQQALMPVPSLLTDNIRKIRVHEDALVTTPLHVAVNHRAERERGKDRHGSTGTGFGETIAYSLDENNHPLRAKQMVSLGEICHFLSMYRSDMGLEQDYQLFNMASAMFDSFRDCYEIVTDEEFTEELSHGHTVFEGAQGFGLDEDFGYHPHTTWSKTTPDNAMDLLNASGVDDVEVYGCLRTYATRHGAGPLAYEGTLDVPGADAHNPTYEWAGAFRTAPWDTEELNRALKWVQPTYLSVSWLDAFDGIMTESGLRNVSDFGEVRIKAYGPNRHDRKSGK